jgi:outer membrane protein assembly factor BamB
MFYHHDIDNFLVALDQKTGKIVWRTPRKGFTRSYSTPIIAKFGGRTEVIVAGSLQLAGYETSSGKKLWWVNQLSRIVDPTPNLVDGVVYIASQTAGGDATERISMGPFSNALVDFDKNGNGAVEKNELPANSPVVPRFFRMDLDQNKKLDSEEWEKHAGVFERAQNVAIAVRLGGEGDVTQTHISWTQKRSLPTVPSSVVYEDIMYMVKDSGIISSIDAKTGELLQQGRAIGRGNYYASLIAGDGKIYLASERGVVTVLKAGRKWTVLADHDVGAENRLYVRTDEALYCFGKAN